MEEFMNSQKSILGISDFLKTAENYSQKNFPDMKLDNIFDSAITGSISTNFWTTSILNLARTRSKNRNSVNDYRFNCNYHT